MVVGVRTGVGWIFVFEKVSDPDPDSKVLQQESESESENVDPVTSARKV